MIEMGAAWKPGKFGLNHIPLLQTRKKKLNEQMLTSNAHICLCPPIILFCCFTIFFRSAMLLNTSTAKHPESWAKREMYIFILKNSTKMIKKNKSSFQHEQRAEKKNLHKHKQSIQYPTKNRNGKYLVLFAHYFPMKLLLCLQKKNVIQSRNRANIVLIESVPTIHFKLIYLLLCLCVCVYSCSSAIPF